MAIRTDNVSRLRPFRQAARIKAGTPVMEFATPGAGFHEKGLEVALDTEQLLYAATTLLNAASLINRIARQT